MALWVKLDCSFDVQEHLVTLFSLRSVIAFFFNWLGFLAVVCLIPTIAARFGAMSGFGLSVVKWITVMRYHEFNNSSSMSNHFLTSGQRSPTHDPAQNFVFALVLFAGFFLFIRGLISYIAVKNRVNQQGQTADVFTWYWRMSAIQFIAFSPSLILRKKTTKKRNSISKTFSQLFSLFLRQYLTCRSRFGCLLENKWRSMIVTIANQTSPKPSNMIRSLLDDRERHTENKRERSLYIQQTWKQDNRDNSPSSVHKLGRERERVIERQHQYTVSNYLLGQTNELFNRKML